MSKLEKQLKSKNLNVYQLSIKAGVPRSSIYRVINNTPKISLISVVKICSVLKCKMTDIIDEENEVYKILKTYENTIYK